MPSGILHRHGQHFPCNSEELYFAVFLFSSFFFSFLPWVGEISSLQITCVFPACGRACHGMQTALTPQGQWATSSCNRGFRDSPLPQKLSSLSWRFGSSRQILKALTKNLCNPWLTLFPSPTGLCLKDLLSPSVFFHSGWSSSTAIPQRVFYFLSGQSSAW